MQTDSNNDICDGVIHTDIDGQTLDFTMQKQQRGFTLIEFVVVIIILGILAVVAAPKFINLKSDALIANLNGLQGALKSANTLVYSKAALAGKEGDATETLDIGSGTEDLNIAYGYIQATKADLEEAAKNL